MDASGVGSFAVGRDDSSPLAVFRDASLSGAAAPGTAGAIRAAIDPVRGSADNRTRGSSVSRTNRLLRGTRAGRRRVLMPPLIYGHARSKRQSAKMPLGKPTETRTRPQKRSPRSHLPRNQSWSPAYVFGSFLLSLSTAHDVHIALFSGRGAAKNAAPTVAVCVLAARDARPAPRSCAGTPITAFAQRCVL